MIAFQLEIGNAGHLCLWNNEHMDGSHRSDVPKSKTVIVFVNNISRDLAIDNLREQAGHLLEITCETAFTAQIVYSPRRSWLALRSSGWFSPF